MNKRAYFIVIEGIEGVGKTTLSKAVSSYLEKLSYEHIMTREPGGTRLAEQVRLLLKDQQYSIDPETELLLMFAARSHHIHEVIKPMLSIGKSVISDRFVDASYAYQGGGRGIPTDKIKSLEQMFCRDIKADITILVTCPVAMAMKRVITRNEKIDRIEQEKISFFEQAQEKYLEIAKNDPSYIIIDGSQSLEDVKKSLNDALENVIQ